MPNDNDQMELSQALTETLNTVSMRLKMSELDAYEAAAEWGREQRGFADELLNAGCDE